MSTWVDPFLDEIVHARQQELLEAARASRVLATTEPTSFASLLRALAKRFRQRPTSNPAPLELDGASHQASCDAVFCQRVQARKDAA